MADPSFCRLLSAVVVGNSLFVLRCGSTKKRNELCRYDLALTHATVCFTFENGFPSSLCLVGPAYLVALGAWQTFSFVILPSGDLGPAHIVDRAGAAPWMNCTWNGVLMSAYQHYSTASVLQQHVLVYADGPQQSPHPLLCVGLVPIHSKLCLVLPNSRRAVYAVSSVQDLLQSSSWVPLRSRREAAHYGRAAVLCFQRHVRHAHDTELLPWAHDWWEKLRFAYRDDSVIRSLYSHGTLRRVRAEQLFDACAHKLPIVLCDLVDAFLRP